MVRVIQCHKRWLAILAPVEPAYDKRACLDAGA